jgi:hypothetical protein
MADTELREIELRLERMHNALSRQEEELESWRHKSARLPNWIRNGGVALFMALFAQSMTAVWWASEYRIASTERYNDIMIELTRIQVTMDNHFNKQE